MKRNLLFLTLSILITSYGDRGSPNKNSNEKSILAEIDYKGTASVTQGLAKITSERIFECEGGRKTDIGLITSTDGKKWVVPASTNFTNQDFPAAADLYNSCNGNDYSTAQEALSKLNGSDIVEIDQDGDQFTAYVFGDNYFEMYINGIPVGKDKIPFSPFNSSIVRFKVSRPFSIAMKLVDWEENLGLGSEAMRGSAFHAGDGGMVAVIKDADDNIVATTNANWKAQTFYTAPIKDLRCATEIGAKRLSGNCDATDSDDGTAYYGLHWDLPSGWEKQSFDDSDWPKATTYTNETIGVRGKKAYTNFTDIFDDPDNDAKFIWSTNVVLDNEVIVRYTVK